MSGPRVLGGLPVLTHDVGETYVELSHEPPYVFRLSRLAAGGPITRPAALATAIYVIEGGLEGSVKLGAGDAAVVENDALAATAGADGAYIVLAARGEAAGPSRTVITRAADLKKVTKPWGHELWITGEHPVLALKQLFVLQGKRLSLQYHHRKRETLILTSGRIQLWYKCNPDVANDAVQEADLGQEPLSPLASFDVTPGCLHRMEGIDDATLYEASTPELDDVVRVADDWARPDGRIDSEHRK